MGLEPVGEVADLLGALAAEGRQRVFDMRWHGVERMPMHHAVGFEPLERLGEHAFADTFDPVSYTHLTLPTKA